MKKVIVYVCTYNVHEWENAKNSLCYCNGRLRFNNKKQIILLWLSQ